MSRKMYWGLSILIVIFVAGGVFVFVKQQRELAELRQGVAEADKLLADHQKQQPKANNKPPRPAQEGFEWEWHGDHWHEMPVAQSDKPIEQSVQNEPLQVFEPEPAQTPPPRTEGVYKEGINGQMLYYPPEPPFESYKHLLDDPEATIRKNAKIILADPDSIAALNARAELNRLELAMHKGYVGGSMWSDEAMKLLDLQEEVLWKPLEAAGHIVRTPVPIKVEGGETE